MTTTKKVKMAKFALIGEEGNAFAIIGWFRRAARQQGWAIEDIEDVVTTAKCGGYDHLIATFARHTEEDA